MIARAFRTLTLCAAVCYAAAVPTPKEHLGFTPGDDFKLADTTQIFGYFQKLAAASDRIRWVEFGRTSNGKPMYVAYISDAANLKRLDRFQEIGRRLARGEATPAEAKALASEGRVVVWIDSGLHATEVAPAQHAPELAYQMVSGESDEIRNIRANVILIQIPVANPDGLDMVAAWYKKNLGTQSETSMPPWLYQKYAGHDNNRDWFMLNLQETRHITKLLFQDWFPQIVYNQHQAPPFPARIFIPPYAEPLNPNIPAAVMEGINGIGMAMKERLAIEGKTGVLSYWGFDGWWNGGLRSVPAFHNIHGILTETAAGSLATPRRYTASGLPASFKNGMPTHEPSIFYQQPWKGGRWGVREAIDYMLSCDFAILTKAAEQRSYYLLKAWQIAQQQIEAGKQGKPYAYVISAAQWDRGAAVEMLWRLAASGITVERAVAPFSAGGKQFPEGSWVLRTAQPFRGYLMDLMEPQKYPELKTGVNGPTKRPYDIAGWTLSMQMGLDVARVEEAFEARLETVKDIRQVGAVTGAGPALLLDHRENEAFRAMSQLLARGQQVRWAADGSIILEGVIEGDAKAIAQEFGVAVRLADAAPKAAWELRAPRVAIYEPWLSNTDAGWTEWVLDRYQIPFTVLRNADLQQAGLRGKFDAVILASQSMSSLLHGSRLATARAGRSEDAPPKEYAGGMGLEGALHLQRFVEEGGTLIAMSAATELPVQMFPMQVRNTLKAVDAGEGEAPAEETATAFYCPGSLLRFTVDTNQPLAFGMPAKMIGLMSGGEAFSGGTPVVHFAGDNLLASGWLSGASVVAGKSAMVDAPLGKGRVVLFGFRPQFRGQPFGTFKLLLNAIFLAGAKPL